MKMKANKTRNELKVSDSNTYRLKTEEWTKKGQRTVKNGGKSSRKCSWKRLGSVTAAPRLGFSSWKHIFSPKIAEMHSLGVMNIFETAPSPIYREKGRYLSPKGFLRKISERTPITKFTPFSYFTKKLQKPYGSILDLIFLFFLFPFTNIKWNMLTQGFHKFYGSITKAPNAIF